MKQKKVNVLYVYNIPKETTFMKKDLEILRRHFRVKVARVSKYRPLSFLRLLRQMKSVQVVYSWWGNVESAVMVFFARMRGIKTVIHAGGVDVEDYPEVHYGDMGIPVYRSFIMYALRNADRVAVSSSDSRKNAMKNVGVKGVIVNYPAPENYFKASARKKNLVLTVATIQKDVILKKGLDIFAECAASFPNTRFAIVGLSENHINLFKEKYSKNLEFYPPVHHKNLRKFYADAKVYCQLSFIESFGISLAESMLAECVPVASTNGSLPEVVGDTGFLVKYGDVKGTVTAIRKALRSNRGKDARKRVLDKFSEKNREEILVSTIEGLLSRQKNSKKGR